MTDFNPKEFKVTALRDGPVQENKSFTQIERHPAVRMLKIEADGDFFKGLIKPKIRVMGYWLERAGFKPGHRVHVTCLAPGVIELRLADSLMVDEAKQPEMEEPF